MLPFGGGFSEVDMKGSLLKRTLETGKTNEGSGGYLQVLNMKQGTDGNWTVNGQPLDPEKIYRVVMPDFLLTGNEQNMNFLKADITDNKGATNNPDILIVLRSDPKNKADLRNDIRLALISYLKG
jgi:5'-nucleotidase